MSWETRRHKTYYYRKLRINGRVTSVYVHPDPSQRPAQATPTPAQFQKQQQARALRQQILEVETSIDELETLVNAITRAALLVSGCHTHKGQWRKKRAKRTNPSHHAAPRTDPGRTQ